MKSVFLWVSSLQPSEYTRVGADVLVYHIDLGCCVFLNGCHGLQTAYQCSRIWNCKVGCLKSNVPDINSVAGKWCVILLQFAFCCKTSSSPMPRENSLPVSSPVLFHAFTLTALLPWQLLRSILPLHYCYSYN